MKEGSDLKRGQFEGEIFEKTLRALSTFLWEGEGLKVEAGWKGALSGDGHAAPSRSELSVTMIAHPLSAMLEDPLISLANPMITSNS